MDQLRSLIFLLLLFIFFSGCRQTTLPVGWKYENYTLTIPFGDGQYHLYAVAEDIIKVGYSDSLDYADKIYAPVLTNPVKTSMKFKGQVCHLTTNKVKAVISVDPFQISFYNKEGVLKLVDNNGFVREADTSLFTFNLEPLEKIFGLGSKSIPLNRRGHKVDCYNQPRYGYGMNTPSLNYDVPNFISSNKYMVLFDNPARAFFDIGKTHKDRLSFGSLGGNQVYYFINGDTYKELLANYIELTGAQPLPPIWAFGNLQSRFGYKTQDEVMEIVQKTKESKIPIDAAIIDLYWFSDEIQDGKMGNLTWLEEKWPDPEAMISELLQNQVKTITVSEPFFINTSTNFEYLSEKKLLGRDESGNTMTIPEFYFGEAGLIDLFKEDARDWFWNEYRKNKAIGVAGWWGDLGEPEKHPDSMQHKGGSARELHGLYGHEWVKLLYDGYTEDYPEERMFMLGRAGFAGSQRYGLIPWSGDVSRSWGGLKAQLPIMLSMGLSGLGYMHSDAGGFAMGQRDSLLYLRWMQFAVFTPVFRPHGDIGVAPSEPALWSKEIVDLIRPWIELRYKLLPYNYTLAWENMTTGLPFARPMFMEFESEPGMDTLQYQYMYGNNFLIAPVLDPTSGIVKVVLPNSGWYNFWNDEYVPGNRTVELEKSLETIPIYVKAGSLVPTAPLYQSTDSYKGDSLILTYYLKQGNYESEDVLYFDDGATKDAYQKEAYQFLNSSLLYTGSNIDLSLSIRGPGYPSAPESRWCTIEFVGITREIDRMELNGDNCPFVTVNNRVKTSVDLKQKANIKVHFKAE